MTDIQKIQKTAARLKHACGSRDPYALAKDLHILVIREPMGNHPGCCKGFFIINKRIPVIVINCDLSEPVQRMVLAHEIGHHQLHKKSVAIMPFTDLTLMDNTNHFEFEANLFAAEFLLDDQDVAEGLKSGYSCREMACTLDVAPELLSFKLLIMKKRGALEYSTPLDLHGAFLKNVTTKT